MIPSDIKNIIFDMGEVLLPVTRDRCLDAFRQIGFADVDRCVGTSYKDGIFQQLELGNIAEEPFLDAVIDRCHPGTTRAQIVDIWNSFIDPIPRKRLDCILELKKQYHVYLLSNTNIIHWKYVCAHDFSQNGMTVNDYFEKMYLSFEQHITKPDRAIFENMLRDFGISAEESFFIDDAPKNCEVAESLGIRSFCSTGDNWLRAFGARC